MQITNSITVSIPDQDKLETVLIATSDVNPSVAILNVASVKMAINMQELIDAVRVLENQRNFWSTQNAAKSVVE